MKTTFIFCLLAIVGVAFAQKTTPPKTGQKNLVQTRGTEPLPGGKPLYTASHALIIGINKYPNLPAQNQLSYAAKDATDLKDVLVKNYGFDAKNVVLLTDGQATLAAIRDTLASFADSDKVGRDDRILVYFSGHGQTVPTPDGGEMGYLIPSDAKVDLNNPANSAPYLRTCLPMRQVWEYLDASPAKHALVIADACFSGLLARMRGGLSKAAAAVLLSRKARMVLTGGSKGEQTSERSDLGHGVFTSKLVEELTSRATTPGNVFTVSDLYASLQGEVASATNGKQNPQIGSFESEGDVLFAAGGLAAPSTFETRESVERVDGVATLSVQSDPPGAAVWIDGVDTGKVAPCEVPLKAANSGQLLAQVRLVMDGFDSATFNVRYQKGSKVPLQGKLTKATDLRAVVHVTSDPPGAKVLVEGVETGKVTPADISVPATADGQKEIHVTTELKGYGDGNYTVKPKIAGSYDVGGSLSASTAGSSGAPVLSTSDPKLKDEHKKVITELQTVMDRLSQDFIGSTQQEKNGKSIFLNGAAGIRSYVREFDATDTSGAKATSERYARVFKSSMADWNMIAMEKEKGGIIMHCTYRLNGYEITLTTEKREGDHPPDILQVHSPIHLATPSKWSMTLTVLRKVD